KIWVSKKQSLNKHFLNSQQHQAISEEAQLLNNPDELMAFFKE
ncbi:hypothetical protein SACIG1242_2962, partial [Staphylococcus aureus subsp. aureus CIG1242]